MKVVLDNIVFSLQKAGGISTYWFELSSRLLRDSNDVFFINRKNENIVFKKLMIDVKKLLKTGVSILLIDRFIDVNVPIFKTPFIFHSSYNRVSNNKNAIHVLTVHDFVHEKYYSGLRRFIHRLQKRKAIKRADAIIVISENTKKDLISYHPDIDSGKIHTIYNGVSNDFYPMKKGEVKNDFLFVGSREKYKNFDFAVIAVSQTNFRLNIVGSKLSKREMHMLNRLLPGRWNIFSNIDNLSLNNLYNSAFALVYPSCYEGFGIPLLEAMKAGCPFIAFNGSSIPEVAGNAGVLISSLEIKEFNKAIINIEQNRDELIKKGFEQVSKFSWEKSYQKTLNVYKKIINK